MFNFSISCKKKVPLSTLKPIQNDIPSVVLVTF